MISGAVPLFLCLLSCQFTATLQQSTWWLSDIELFYEDPAEGPTIFNTIYEDKTRIKFTKVSTDSQFSYSHDLTYAAEFIVRPEASREPLNIRFSVIIHHILSNFNYNISINEELSGFTWSHGSAYSFSNDTAIYYVAAPGKEPIRISDDGEGQIEHTKQPRWDIIDDSITEKQNNAYFSPSDKYVAHYSSVSNSSDNSANVVIITTYDGFEKYDYNYDMSQDYVKTGDKEHTIQSISIWDVEKKESRVMDIQLRDQSAAYYAFPSTWLSLHGKELFLATWANRWQNETTLSLCDFETATCSLAIYEHKYAPKQWATEYNIVYSNSSIFVILPIEIKDNAWEHITKIEITPDLKLKSISHVPSGEYDIKQILAYRPNEDLIVYQAQAPNPWNMHVYAAPAGERSQLQQDQCLTCGNAECTYQERATVAPGANFTIDFMCNGPAPPRQQMIFLDGALHQEDIVSITEPNAELAAEAANRTEWIIDTFELSSGFEAIVRIYDGDADQDLVPVTLIVYGGPDSNQAVDSFEYSANLPIGYTHAIVKIDVRGSGGRGWNYRSAIYGRLVTVEVGDTIEAIKMVLDKYPRLDRDRVGVYGASYGGTMTLALVEKAPHLFKCAISEAPVTNFYYYNAMYTESFMGDAPPSVYTDLNQNVNAFLDTNLLLIHGLRDDRVLFRHSALLIEALQQADVPFELMVYPNQDHNIGGKVDDHRTHLVEKFLEKCYE